jgi:hypothetical protein
MRCFVAMAFGRQDTDAVFRHCIAPAVKTCCGSNARRVDRVEHNDDIDNRIIAEIEDADFLIADLTYARPSVYFEAGYAQRKIPVIYTVRHDHFRDKSDIDPHGNLRVHFDLQMKNIIDWRHPKDALFLRRLQRRIRFVTRPLQSRKTENEARSEAIAQFARLPVNTRISQARVLALDALERLGYSDERKRKDSTVRRAQLFRVEGAALASVTVKALNSVLKGDLESFLRYNQLPLYNLNVGGKRPRFVKELIIVCSLRNVSPRSIGAVFDRYDFNAQHLTFSLNSIYSIPGASVFKPGNEVHYRRDSGPVRS